MRKKLPTGETQLFSCAALACMSSFASIQSAQADTYAVCRQQPSSQRDCIPGSGGSSTLPATINLQSSGGSEGVTVFDWKVKNCKQKVGQLRGYLSIILDNSKSATTTDPSASRAVVLNRFIDEFARKSLQSGESSASVDFPKISLTNYNGRVGTLNSNAPVDEYNPGFTPSYCSQSVYPAPESLTDWDEAEESTKLSRCEYLPLVPADAGSSAVVNLKAFAAFAASQPRGSTDFTYFFRAAGTTLAGANPSNVGNNVLVITDGLPNIPKNVAASTCKSSPRLQNEAIVSGEPLRGAGTKEYCVDRQVLTAISEANAEALKPDYQTINFHHVLYTENQRAYFDYDESGRPRVNPASFLIENSARTGNGKVKFSYATDETELQNQLAKTFDNMDISALQYVRVQVQPPGGVQAYEYNAVSPSAPGSDFSIKFIGLKTGSNTVTVTPVFQDRSSTSQTFTVNVGNTGNSDLSCSEQDVNLTVDGDPIGDLTPNGDGFYHTPKGGDFRDYRNSDPSNLLSENEFAVVGDEQAAMGLRKLRLQGGTGNCGVVAGVSHSQSKTNFMLWALLLAPLGIVRVQRRRIGGR